MLNACKGGFLLKKHLLKSIGMGSLLFAKLAAGATKTIAFFEPKE